MIILVLVLLGLAAGSFVNALVWRVNLQELAAKSKAKNSKAPSIINGRSMCPNCRHTLAWYDLVPVLSWLWLRGKCRYCHKPISAQYPIVELIMTAVFVASYVFWPETIHLNGQWLLFGSWLVSSVGLLALAVYDLRWMLLPSRILYPTFVVAFAGRVGYIASFADRPLHAIWLLFTSLLVSSGVFWLMFEISKGRWIGFGDVRLGLVTGTLLASPDLSLMMIFFASLAGSLMVLPAVAVGQRKMTSKLPFGPFLILATAIVILFGASILNWYENLLGV